MKQFHFFIGMVGLFIMLFSLEAFAAPQINSISPATAKNSGPVKITNISGDGFQKGDTVTLTKDGEIIHVLAFTLEPDTITGLFDAKGAASGKWDVVVTNSDGESDVLSAGITLEAPPVALKAAMLAAPAVQVKVEAERPYVDAATRLEELLATKVEVKTNRLKLDSIEPNTADNSDIAQTIILTGKGFNTGDQVHLSKRGQADIPVLAVAESSGKITGLFNATGAEPGAWDVVVTKPSGWKKKLRKGMTLTTATAEPEVAASLSMMMVAGVDIHVPADYATIQQAIDNANNGDTIIVAPGTYVENISYNGKAVTVISSDGPEVTTIDGNASDVVVSFWNYEGSDSVLDGFTITNGNGGFGGGIVCITSSPTVQNCIISANTGYFGGGIFVWGGTIITNCMITDNIALDGGGGLYNAGNSLITNCTISGNAAANNGGGVRASFSSVMTVVNSIFWGDTAAFDNEINLAGATADITYSDIEGGFTGVGNIDIDPSFIGGGDFHIGQLSACVNAGTSTGAPSDDIDGDYRPLNGAYDIGADEVGNAVYVPSDYSTIQDAINAVSNGWTVVVAPGTYVENIDFIGKAITVISSGGPEVTVIDAVNGAATATAGVSFHTSEGQDSVLDGFTVTNAQGGFGGAISGIGANPTILNCILTNNFAAGWGGGAFFFTSNGPTTMENCIITNNTVNIDGGGIYFGATSHTITLTNSTISDNTATGSGGGGTSYGGGLRISGGDAVLTNDIFWNNSASYDQEISVSGTLSATYSDIEGGYAGIGNIDLDPLFVGGGDYHITASSNCKDVGTSAGAPSNDIDGDLRPQYGGYDMGADEYQ